MSAPTVRDTGTLPKAEEQEEKDDLKEKDLPGHPRPDGNINWLGSSFSGVDIKVVAHLYGTVDRDEATERLRHEQHTAQRIADGAAQAAINADLILEMILENNEGEDIDRSVSFRVNFLQIIGFNVGDSADAEDAEAADFLWGVFQSLPFDPKFSSVWVRRFDGIASSYHSLADNLQDKLSRADDIRAKSSSTITLATLQTLSIQTHREKFAVRSLGSSYAKGYTRGPRTIAGSMVFTMFEEHALAKLIRAMSGKGSVYGERDTDLSSLIADQLPPLDLTIAIANEYGQLSQMGIYGVEFVNDGITMSVEDILTEEVCQFVARDCDVLTGRGKIGLMRDQRGMHFGDGSPDQSASSLLFTSETSYNNYIDKLAVRRRLINR